MEQSQSGNNPEQTPQLPSEEMLVAQQQQLATALLEKGLISQEFSETGFTSSFYVDATTGQDAFTHILIGDEGGGAHHLRTIMDLGIQGRTVASRIVDQSNPGKSHGKLRKEQKVSDSGVYKARHVDIESPNGKVYEKPKGSNMFPNEWNSEQVIKALLDTAASEPIEFDDARNSAIHHQVVDGVNISVVTDKQSGKIITGFPK